MIDPSEKRGATRIPLCVPVVTDPVLADCSSLNVSVSGIAITAAAPLGAPPVTGTLMDLEILLPGGSATATARIEWVRRDGSTRGREQIALGMSYVDLPPASRAALRRVIAEYRPRVLLALADTSTIERIRTPLEREFAVEVAHTRDEACDLVGATPFAAIVVFGRVNDAEAIAKAAGVDPDRRTLHGPFDDPAPRVVFAGEATHTDVIALFDRGLVNRSLARPVEVGELMRTLASAAADFAAQSELHRLGLQGEREAHRRAPVPAKVSESIVFRSATMTSVMDLVSTAARHPIAVLLVGETGTGKELIARAIHDLSTRAANPFVAQDCGALTETLLESELFGHVRGSFTGAIANHPGLFAIGEGGTVFLDEIENTTHAMQAKLLRVLETGEVRPVGGTTIRKVDVRIVAASNRDLWAEVQAGRFRPDLYFRLNRFVVEIPPLRARGGDIALLTEVLLRRLSADLGRTAPPTVSPQVMRLFESYEWPGNVRELRNVLERALLLTPEGGRIEASVLPGAINRTATPSEPTSLRKRLERFERTVIEQALARHGGVVRRAARELSMNPITLARRAKRLGILPG